MEQQEKKLIAGLRHIFEEAVDLSDGEDTMEMEGLLVAFQAVGAIVFKMDYNQGYEIDYEGRRHVAEIFKAPHCLVGHGDNGHEAKIEMAKKPTDARTVDFIKTILAKYPAPAGQ